MKDVRTRMTVRWALAAILLGLALLVLWPFLNGLAWSAVVVVSLWPVYRGLRKVMPGGSRSAAAVLMSLALAFFLVLAMLPLGLELSRELKISVKWLQTVAAGGTAPLAGTLAKVPVVGGWIGSLAAEEIDVREAVVKFLSAQQENVLAAVSYVARGVVSFLGTVIFLIFCSFFFFRDGDALAGRLVAFARSYGTESGVQLIYTAWNTVLGVMYGVLSTAIAQGVLAAIGYTAAGVPSPVLLGCVTSLFSLIPFGTPLVYLPVAAWIFLDGGTWYAALGLALWGICVVSLADNLLRPFFLSYSANLPLLVAFLGVIGGIVAFGAVGVFFGPVILAVTRVMVQAAIPKNSAGGNAAA